MGVVVPFEKVPKKKVDAGIAVPNSDATLEERMAVGDLRKSKKAICHECQHLWWAPTIGKCPRCTATNVQVVREQELDYKRV